MKKNLLIGAATLIVSIPTFAGDYLTNTNQNAAFLRMVARGASIDIDGVYSNPAGLAFLPEDGFHLSLTGQSAYQTREILATSPLWTLDGNTTERYYKGTASAPIIPSFHGAYKKDRWVISASFAITGGGGKASFDNGLPMFDALATGMIAQQTGGKITPNMYEINSAMDGKQYIYGVQLGASYRINDWLSAFVGGRMNYVKSGYEGYSSGGSYQNTASSEDNLQFQAVYNYINARQYQQALNVLSRMQNRNAQWYYLSACANMGMGNNVNALNLARQAQSMDPGNPEYANLVNRLQWNSNRYQGGSYYGGGTGGSSCGTGNMCCDLWCADTLCECMGGDLCSCM